MEKISGTKEWAVATINFQNGCSNNCKYCFARAMVARTKRIHPAEWENEEVREKDVEKKYKKYDGQIMCPSSHDISIKNLPDAATVLEKLLEKGNQVLIVSKPNFYCISTLVNKFKEYRKQILFRFSIGSADDEVLKYWEPGATDFKEREKCLRYAYQEGYETSVSCEPMLDNHVEGVVRAVKGFVTDSIWIGKANRIKSCLSLNGFKDEETMQRADQLNAWHTDERIMELYKLYEENPMIKWKESIKRIVGLEEATERGQDQ